MFTDYRYYRKRPVIVEAVRLDATNMMQVADWIREWGGATAGLRLDPSGPIAERGIHIGTLEGIMHAPMGSWVIKGIQGEFYPCQDKVFRQTFDLADELDLPSTPHPTPYQSWIATP